MFSDSLLDSSSLGHSHRGWTTLTSFALQAAGLTIVLAVPLLYTEGLPQVHLRDLLLTPPPPVVTSSPASSHPAAAQSIPVTVIPTGALQAPRQIPLTTYTGPDVPAAPTVPFTASGMGVDHGVGVGSSTAITDLFSTPVMPFSAPSIRTRPVSRWMEGNLIRRVQPSYPPLARSTGIQGSVLLLALIGRDGTIRKVQVVNGHPLLVKAAVDAVSQWLYRPYYLNDQAVEVETQVTVNFTLER